MSEKPAPTRPQPAPPATTDTPAAVPPALDVPSAKRRPSLPSDSVEEVGGRGGLDPTRYNDWEKNGRCVDF